MPTDSYNVVWVYIDDMDYNLVNYNVHRMYGVRL